MEQEQDIQVQLLEEIAGFTHDPLNYCLYSFPWGERDLEKSEGPYKWQEEVFGIIGKHLSNPKTVHTPLRIAVASGHGIGKSAGISMLIAWAMSTCEDCKIIVTAGTGTQLQTKTQPEIAKWFRLAINSHWFDVKSKSVTIKDEKHKDGWRADLITWDAQNSEAFAGLHNKGKRIVIIFDEAAAIAKIIWDVVQGALTDADTEIIWLAFGNPTQNTGGFSECFGSDKARWVNYQIDSRDVDGTNKNEITEWINKYGEDSDYVRVRVRGEFPRGGTTQFIPSDIIAAARAYKAAGFERLPRILTCDVARFGDDETVIGERQGRKFQILATYRGLDTVQTAERLIEWKELRKPDAVVIDGDGIGGAVVDHMKHRGYKEGIFEFHGGEAPRDPRMYYNKRAECWGEARDWLKDGAQIPDDADMARQLASVTYFLARGKVNNGSICLEAKEDLKKRGMPSPDKGDALAMSFGVRVAPKKLPPPPKKPVSAWS